MANRAVISAAAAKWSSGGADVVFRSTDGYGLKMRVIATTNDWVRLSFLSALLRDGGVEPVILDGHVAAAEGSIGAVPRRLAVATQDAPQAMRILREAGEA
jgi:hypothetical protein